MECGWLAGTTGWLGSEMFTWAVLLFALLVFGLAFLRIAVDLRRADLPAPSGGATASLDLLDQRHAAGEIGPESYERIRAVLLRGRLSARSAGRVASSASDRVAATVARNGRDEGLDRSGSVPAARTGS